MHNRTLQDIREIIYRDTHPDGEMPSERYQTHPRRAEVLIKEIESLITQNERIADLVAIAFNLGSREEFKINGMTVCLITGKHLNYWKA
jgi:hypothetical protein